jgi:hypothetical protein
MIPKKYQAMAFWVMAWYFYPDPSPNHPYLLFSGGYGNFETSGYLSYQNNIIKA